MNLQTIKLNMLNDLKGIERDEITEEQAEAALKANFHDTLMRTDEDMQKMAEWFQDLGQNGFIHSKVIAHFQVGFFDIILHENYVDSASDDYVYTYEIEQNEWPGIN